MPITTRCPECGHKYRFDAKHAGRQAKCKNGHVFTVAPDIQAEATEVESPQPSERVAQAVRRDRTYRLAFLAIEAGCVRELKRMHLERKPLDEPHEISHRLVDMGIDENGTKCVYRESLTETPLQAAVSHGHLDAVVFLLQVGCNPWKRNANAARSALEEAQLASKMDIIDAMLDPANYKPTEDGSSLLHEAARANCQAGIRLLLEHGASVNAKNKKGRTPVYEAAYRGYDECVKLLLSRGASPEDVEKGERNRDIEKERAGSKVE